MNEHLLLSVFFYIYDLFLIDLIVEYISSLPIKFNSTASTNQFVYELAVKKM